MKRIYAVYGLTLLPALLVYWMFAAMATVSTGSTWVPFSLATGAVWGVALCALPLLMNGMVVYYQGATFGQTQRPPLLTRVLMSIPPLAVLVAFLAYYI